MVFSVFITDHSVSLAPTVGNKLSGAMKQKLPGMPDIVIQYRVTAMGCNGGGEAA
jgi:hypothetical protein